MPPWEKYQQQTGPWMKYSAPEAAPAQAAPEMSFGEQAGDVAKSLGVGAARGAIGVVGLPGDIEKLGGMAGSWLRDTIRGRRTPEEEERAAETKASIPSLLPSLPGAADIQQGIEGVTGEFYQPKSTAGKYARTGGEFLPAALGGGGGLAARAARVAVPAGASEAAGQATEGTAFEPYARVGSAVVGALAPGALSKALTRKPTVLSLEQLGTGAKAAYKEMENANVVMTPYKADLIHKDVWGTLAKKGFDPDVHPAVNSALKSLESISGQPTALQTLHLKRQLFSDAAKDKGQSRLVRKAIERIDDHISGMQKTDVLTGDPAKAAEAFKRGNQLYHRKSKAETIATAMKKAERAAARSGSGGNIDNAIRQKLSQILDNPKRSRGFTADELAEMENVVNTGKMQNFTRLIGKLSPQGSGLMAALGIGGAAAFPPLAAIPAAGYVSKAIADSVTRGKANRLSELIRSGGKAAPKSQDSATQQALIAALLAATPDREPLRITVNPRQQPVQ